MSAKSVSKFVRISPQKARYAAALIRGKDVNSALLQLQMSPLKGARLLAKTLKSAIANADAKHKISADDLRVVEVCVDAGPTLKRAKPKNRGGRHPILKRTSHFKVIVADKEGVI